LRGNLLPVLASDKLYLLFAPLIQGQIINALG
jgi:hypothetical protein